MPHIGLSTIGATAVPARALPPEARGAREPTSPGDWRTFGHAKADEGGHWRETVILPYASLTPRSRAPVLWRSTRCA